MVTYDEIVAELTAEWEVGVIALPKFANGHLSNTNKIPNIEFIKVNGATIKPKTSNNRAFLSKQRFFIYIVASDLEDLEKFRQQTSKIILSMGVVGGHMNIVIQQDPEVLQKRYNQRISYEEIQHKRYTEL